MSTTAMKVRKFGPVLLWYRIGKHPSCHHDVPAIGNPITLVSTTRWLQMGIELSTKNSKRVFSVEFEVGNLIRAAKQSK